MVAAVSDASSTWLLPLWVLGVVVLALVLGYAIHRAGYLHRGERERLDRNTGTIRQAEAGPEMQRAEEQRSAERSPPLADVQQPTPPLRRQRTRSLRRRSGLSRDKARVTQDGLANDIRAFSSEVATGSREENAPT